MIKYIDIDFISHKKVRKDQSDLGLKHRLENTHIRPHNIYYIDILFSSSMWNLSAFPCLFPFSLWSAIAVVWRFLEQMFWLQGLLDVKAVAGCLNFWSDCHFTIRSFDCTWIEI